MRRPESTCFTTAYEPKFPRLTVVVSHDWFFDKRIYPTFPGFPEVVARFLPTFPGYRSCWSRSSVPGGSAATKIDRSRLVQSQNGKMPAPLGRNSLLCVHQGVPLPSSAVASDLISRSRWCRRRPKLGDQHQDFLEHLSRHRDLGHLKGCGTRESLPGDPSKPASARPFTCSTHHGLSTAY